MARKVSYEQSARDDLHLVFQWIADAADVGTAAAYVGRIQARCDGLAMFPERGTPRNDIAPGLRTIPSERRAVIVYVVEPEVVRVLRILHKGRDPEREFSA